MRAVLFDFELPNGGVITNCVVQGAGGLVGAAAIQTDLALVSETERMKHAIECLNDGRDPGIATTRGMLLIGREATPFDLRGAVVTAARWCDS